MPFYLVNAAARAVEHSAEIAKEIKAEKGAGVENKLSSKMGQLIISLGSLFARFSSETLWQVRSTRTEC